MNMIGTGRDQYAADWNRNPNRLTDRSNWSGHPNKAPLVVRWSVVNGPGDHRQLIPLLTTLLKANKYSTKSPTRRRYRSARIAWSHNDDY